MADLSSEAGESFAEYQRERCKCDYQHERSNLAEARLDCGSAATHSRNYPNQGRYPDGAMLQRDHCCKQ
jgi:hypothetical protein